MSKFTASTNYSSLSDPNDRFAGSSGAYTGKSGLTIDQLRSKSAPQSSWDPRNWGWKGWSVAAVVGAVVIVAATIGGVEGAKADAYPDYSKLSYSLTDSWSGTDFFDYFDYYTLTDPSDGFVVYVNSTEATSLNLTYASSTSAVLRVDNTLEGQEVSSGRQSVRITSKTQYDDGLFIFDILHSPYGCATWPAVWLTDPSNWPDHGEIDVLEAVNQAANGNQMTLHTSDGCTMQNVKRKETGTVDEANCYIDADDNDGCGVTGPDDTIGEAFNNLDGGVYAMELRSAGIRVWFWSRANIPTDITDETPNPESWGTALADFPSTDCDISTHFKNQSIIANIDVCGSWAGQTSVYTTEDSCPDTCEEYATNNATAFDNAYWEFYSFKIYTAS